VREADAVRLRLCGSAESPQQYLLMVAPGRFLRYQRAHHLAMDGFSGFLLR
jgi:hypothetical protein